MIHQYKSDVNFLLDLERGNYIDDYFLSNKIYEPHVVRNITQYARGVCIDIGANWGCHSLRMAKLCSHVHCFEASPIRSRLVKNLELNNISNSTVYDCMLGDSNRQNVTIDWEYLWSKKDHSGVSSRIDMRTLDSFNFSEIDFLKIDVDGSEGMIIDGGKSTIARCLPIIQQEFCKTLITEDNGVFRRTLESGRTESLDIACFYRSLGYEISQVNDTKTKISTIEQLMDFISDPTTKAKNSVDVLFLPRSYTQEGED